MTIRQGNGAGPDAAHLPSAGTDPAGSGGWRPQPPGPPPDGLDPDELFSSVSWHQRWEVFEGIFTPGRNPVSEIVDSAGLPADLRSLRVLDIGAWHGCFSFECERRGAREVVALSLEDPAANGFERLRRVLRSKAVSYQQGSVYDLHPATHGTFDVVLFFGVLYHLRYPLLAIDRIRQICRGKLYVETHVIDSHFIAQKADGTGAEEPGPLPGELVATPLWRFYKGDELAKGDLSNWFGPNIQAVLDALETSGFSGRLIRTWGDRASFEAMPAIPLDAALKRTYEGKFPATRRFLGLSS